MSMSDDETRFRARLIQHIQRRCAVPGVDRLVDMFLAEAWEEGFRVILFHPPAAPAPRFEPVLARHDGGIDRAWRRGDAWALALAGEYDLTGVTGWARTPEATR